MMIDPLIVKVISLYFGLLFLLAAAHKLSAPAHFRAVLEAYELMQRAFATPVARAVPLIEFVLGISWLVLPKVAIVAAISTALIALYSFGIAVNLYRGRTHIDCGCTMGGPVHGHQKLSHALIVRNSVLVVVALVSMVPANERVLGLLDYVTLLPVLILGVLLHVASNQLMGNDAAMKVWRNLHD